MSTARVRSMLGALAVGSFTAAAVAVLGLVADARAVDGAAAAVAVEEPARCSVVAVAG